MQYNSGMKRYLTEKLSQKLYGIEKKMILAEEYESKRNQLIARLNYINKSLEQTRNTVNHIVKIYKNISKNEQERKETQINNLRSTIKYTSSVVPDAEYQGVDLEIPEGKNEAYISNANGADVTQREGGAYKTVLSALMRYACLLALPDAVPLIIFDESFFACSDYSIARFKDYLREMSKTMVIIVIDQRRFVAADLANKAYYFIKKDGKTNVLTDKEFSEINEVGSMELKLEV